MGGNNNMSTGENTLSLIIRKRGESKIKKTTM